MNIVKTVELYTLCYLVCELYLSKPIFQSWGWEDALDTGSTEKAVSSPVLRPHVYSLSPFLSCLLGSSSSYILPTIWKTWGFTLFAERGFLETPPTCELQCDVGFPLIPLTMLESVMCVSLPLGPAADSLCHPVGLQPAQTVPNSDWNEMNLLQDSPHCFCLFVFVLIFFILT